MSKQETKVNIKQLKNEIFSSIKLTKELNAEGLKNYKLRSFICTIHTKKFFELLSKQDIIDAFFKEFDFYSTQKETLRINDDVFIKIIEDLSEDEIARVANENRLIKEKVDFITELGSLCEKND